MAKRTKSEAGEATVTVDRRREERREATAPTKPERRKTPRRRQIDPTTCERDYSDDEIEFMHALDDYKRRAGRMFPTCSEVLEVLRDLGYVRLTSEEKERLDSFQNEGGETVADVAAEAKDDADEVAIEEEDCVAG